MEEPKRFSLLDVILKSLNRANKRAFNHRVLYIINTGDSSEGWLHALEQSVKAANEEVGPSAGKWDQLGALALYCPGYILVLVESDDDTLYKHILALRKECEGRLALSKWKILAYIPHISKRYLVGWVCSSFHPPILLQRFYEQKELGHYKIKLQQLVLNLYEIMKYVSELNPSEFRQGIHSLSRACRKYLPETPLLDILFTSPMMLPAELLFDDQVPDYTPEEDKVWPLPS